MFYAKWDQAVSSKVRPSLNLHTLLPELDFFIMLSSVSGIMGNPVQGDYAAGCAFQDELAKHRVEEDEFLSLLNICCDTAYQITLAAESQITVGMETPADRDAKSLDPMEILEQPLYAYFNGHSNSSHAGMSADTVSLSNAFGKSGSREERARLVVDALSRKLARALSIKAEDVDADEPLHAFGVDSLVAVEIRSWIAKQFAADVAISELTGRANARTVTVSAQYFVHM
ncbi:KR domain-containing protein [Stachybotrys elegans]|uniref:KR domain-containing protein n=1 Tax=Stachybotrys elegans TaxID=80388 RepID=A0A8K0SJ79_9HYPO|nr:KR domain-containing protein [Stachybotrys elegans]